MDESDFARLRRQMIEEQIVPRHIRDGRVIQALEKIPRHLFVPPEHRSLAYEDRPVSIGPAQTVSQPYIVAFMTEALQVRPGDRILEIGGGSGYQAAVLEELGAEVFSVELVPELARTAEENLRRAGYSRTQVTAGDGSRGWPEHAPYDAVVVTCAPPEVPPALFDQLREGGRLVIPLGPENQIQNLSVFQKVDGRIVHKDLAPVRFVSMKNPEGPQT